MGKMSLGKIDKMFYTYPYRGLYQHLSAGLYFIHPETYLFGFINKLYIFSIIIKFSGNSYTKIVTLS